MINFRFHLVSLIAVFLALAVGIVVGSTVIDQAIVDGLRDQIDRVEAKADARKVENDGLKDELDRMSGYVEGSAGFAVQGRLRGVPVVVLAERGVDGDAVDATLGLVRSAGAVAPYVVWLEKGWRLDDERARESLGALVGAVDDPDLLRARGFEALAEWLAGGAADRTSKGASGGAGRHSTDARDGGATPPEGATTTTTDATADATTDSAQSRPAVLQPLVDAGLLSLDHVRGADGSFPGAGARAVVVTGSGSTLSSVAALTEALVAAGVPTVAAEVYAPSDGDPDRGATLAGVLGDDALADRVTTVDDLELVEGRVSAVIGLQALADGAVGHYGYGSGATRSLPEWTAP